MSAVVEDLKPVNLIYRDRKTNAFFELEEAVQNGCVTMIMTSGFNSKNPAISKLVAAGLLEKRQTGPRGGSRFHPTKAGIAKLKATLAELERLE